VELGGKGYVNFKTQNKGKTFQFRLLIYAMKLAVTEKPLTALAGEVTGRKGCGRKMTTRETNRIKNRFYE